MMAILRSETRKQNLMSDLRIARGFFERAVGLLSWPSMEPEQGLWIHRCNTIHTYFMRFSIDCVFLDKNLRVKAVRRNVSPWRFVLPIWGAKSVLELPTGSIDRLQISVGEQLNVGA